MKKKLLIVEDERTLLKVLKERFSKEGYEVSTAGDGAVALEMALTDHPDLILLDIVMPIMDGMTVLKKLRGNEWGKDVPVVLLTNLNIADKVADALDRGVYDYLVKSDWSLEDIVTKVNERLS
ncbi:MAG: response regulator [Patescibacteria group bacterium]|jgi:DNA-binding response OmpR family regulator